MDLRVSVWVLVLGVVAVVLYPVFAPPRYEGKFACLSHVKQLLTASAIYTSDHDERLMPAKTWIDSSFVYIKNGPAFSCPDLPKGRSTAMR